MSEEIRVHHPFSPSSLQNREACPCWQNTNSTNEAAIRGTLQHGMAETGEDDQRVSDDHALHAAECIDFVERQKKLMEEERDREITLRLNEGPFIPEPGPVLDLVEAYLPIDDCTFEEPLFNPETNQIEDATIHSTTGGYADRILISFDKKRAVLIDYKYGSWIVPNIPENTQAISYALGIFFRYPSVEEVKCYFKMPALDVTREGVFTRSEIPALYLRIQTIVARAREANRRIRESNDFSMATPTSPGCNFCNRLGVCPKVLEIALSVGKKFHPLEIPSDLTPTGLKSGEDTSLGLRLAQVLAVWAKSFRSQITERVICRGGEIPPGFKIQTRKDREIVDTPKFRDVSLKYVTQEELAALATYTFGSIEEKISAAAPRGSKASTVKEYQQALLDSGAVKYGDEYSFLRGVSERE